MSAPPKSVSSVIRLPLIEETTPVVGVVAIAWPSRVRTDDVAGGESSGVPRRKALDVCRVRVSIRRRGHDGTADDAMRADGAISPRSAWYSPSARSVTRMSRGESPARHGGRTRHRARHTAHAAPKVWDLRMRPDRDGRGTKDVGEPPVDRCRDLDGPERARKRREDRERALSQVLGFLAGDVDADPWRVDVHYVRVASSPSQTRTRCRNQRGETGW